MFLGSYYGYWAAWAVPAVAARGGRVTLVDPDPTACAVARRNFAPYGDAVRIVSRDRRKQLLAAEPSRRSTWS